ncbi:MAG: tetratricopeptide repeat protein [Candidatus Kuenenia sp.]|nr:tetratricopeptide repeat protein [Candidatus Kuenenia hertensis]
MVIKNLNKIVPCVLALFVFYGCGKQQSSDTIGAKDEGVIAEGDAVSQEAKKVVKIPENMTAEQYYTFGLENIKKGQFDVSIAAWEKAIELDPAMVKVYEKLGKAYYTLGKFSKSSQVYRKAIELEPYDAMLYFSLGVVYRMNLQYEDAIDVLMKSLSFDPNLAIVYNELGLVYCKQKMLDEAIAAHKKALELDPKLGNAHNYLGVVYLLKGMSKEAEEEFDEYKKYEAGIQMPPGHGAPASH